MDFRGSNFLSNLRPLHKTASLHCLGWLLPICIGFLSSACSESVWKDLRQKETNFVVSIFPGETLTQLTRPPFQLAEGVFVPTAMGK